ncbi:MAG: hypothetical protein JST40_08605 [Armatimonadetes bacterium]|nr:hypothetical protein [Armatimonadota bacterium]
MTASLGGNVTVAEANVVIDEIVRELNAHNGGPFMFELDYSAARRLDDGVTEALQVAQTYAKLRGADKYVCVARTEHEIEYLTSMRLQQVLEGHEEYRLAA